MAGLGTLMSEELRYERVGAAAVLTIDRPERRNAVDAATAELFRQGLRDFEADEGARVLVLTGAGGEAFCAGRRPQGDEPRRLPSRRADGPDPAHPVEAGDRRDRGLVPRRRRRAGALVRHADRDPGLHLRPLRAALGSAAARRGHPAAAAGGRHGPGAGDDPHRPPVDAEEAHRIGLVNEVVEPGRHLERALELAERIASFPQETMLADRRGAIEGFGMPLADGLAHEASLGNQVLDVAVRGAARFAGGEGRHGAF